MDTPKGYLLVVEDIPDILKLLEATLTFKGHRVVTALNGEEALDAIERERPAMVITDILMPKMDGFSLVHRLRINPDTRDIPVVFLSATYVAPEDKAFALTIGVTRFIEKPVAMDKFVPMIERILKQGIHATTEPINEFDFYDGYRKRLEIKLNQKNIQIARDERLLESLSEEEKPSFQASLHQAVSEREEIKHLLDQIREQLEKFSKPE
ncbi:MAG: response regulator [Anaerolineae bacterium]|nr:response regulator [Anaerolineae bacterium]MCI0609898.1 response regulator [Anaerolineae bacterium]